MQRDIRETALYREAETFYRAMRQPGAGLVTDAADINASPDGTRAVFTGMLVDKLEGSPSSRICEVDLASGDTRVLTFGPNADRLPKYSPEGRQIAFLSDRSKPGDFQLHLLDRASGAARAAPTVDGWVEYFHWSRDGRQILLGVAGHGADVAGGQGAVASKQIAKDLPSWMPAIETGDESFRWRRAWVYDVSQGILQVVGTELNIWEAAWCGNDSIVAVASAGSGEGLWYTARLHVIAVRTGKSREIYSPKDQLGWPAASPSGSHLAVVEAVCSDRGIVAGDLQLLEVSTGKARAVDTRGIDVTHVEWCSNQKLLVAGHRGFETAVGLHDLATDEFSEAWSSVEPTGTGRYVTVSALDDSGDFALVGESFVRAPEIAAVRHGRYQAIKSFDACSSELLESIAAAEPIEWKAPDGLEIQGWLLRPQGTGPHPLIMHVHGGPVGHWRPGWLGRAGAASAMLLKRGYAIFLPNPRGSSGRGREFARRVIADMGGADAQDCLSGLDHLVRRGIADPTRLGVMGGSYGGFMTAWLITQDTRFAAAIPVAPVTNQVTEHLISNIPHFVSLFVADEYQNLGGEYFRRSPVMFAHQARTPTLNICGALDRCTPPEEAVQFHNALLENGVKSVLATYPEEGHGIRKWPAGIDYAARVVGWFDEHMRAWPDGHKIIDTPAL